MKRNGLYGRRCLAVGLLVVVLNGALSGCAMPEDFAGILRPVEEVVSTVRQNMELRQQMNALELPKDVESISSGRYAYETLPAEEKIIYDQMLDAVMNHEEEVTLSTSDGRRLEDIFNCVKADHGGLGRELSLYPVPEKRAYGSDVVCAELYYDKERTGGYAEKN